MLSSKNRLEKKYFKQTFTKGKRFPCVYFNIFYKESGEEEVKIGFVVPSSVAKKAVLRNKIKRRAREILRMLLNDFKNPYLIVFLFKKDVLKLSFKELKKEIESVLSYSGLIK